jgi:hypothetical protein
MKTKSLLVCSFALAIILGLCAGCSIKADDAKTSSEIQGKFSQDSGLSNKQLTVQANNGVVTLGGMVDNDAQRDAAGRLAASISGVKTVVNNLQVGAAMATATNSAMASNEPAKTERPATAPPADAAKPAPGKGSSKSHASKNSHAAQNQVADSDADQMPGSDQDTPSSSAQDNEPAPASDNSTASATPPPPPPAPKKLIIDQGTQLTVRLVDPIDSEKNQTGETFRATLNAPLTSDGEEAVPAGVELVGHLAEVKSAGKFAGQSEVVLQLDSIKSGGQSYSLQTDQYKKTGSSRGKNTAEKVGAGAVVGGIIGAIAGGGKGAAIGSAAGAGVGGGVQAATKGQQIKLPSETVLNFTLQAPITVVQAASDDANRQKLGDSQ